MDVSESNKAEQKRLRHELKSWEREFADANGRKPTREEIKRDKAIAAKYTAYQKLLDSSTTKDRPKTSSSYSSQTSRPQSSSSINRPSRSITTPTAIPPSPTNSFAPSNPFDPPSSSSKSTTTSTSRPTTSTSISTIRTPSKFRTPNKLRTPSGQHEFESPLSTRGRRLFGNRRAKPLDCVGPTPQATGRVLGIFEALAGIPDDEDDVDGLGFGTPSRKRTGRTAGVNSPVSTPRKRRAGDMGSTPGKSAQKTAGTGADVFSTPAVLRRTRMGKDLEESPALPEAKWRRPMGKGLSVRVAELRMAVDRAFDDDEEALREVESGELGSDIPAPKKPEAKKGKGKDNKKTEEAKVAKEMEEMIEETIIMDNDPNTGLPPLPEGAWRDEELVEEEVSGEEKEDKTRKWKKKGLKRQHRRVIMRPATIKSKTTTVTGKGEEEEAPPPPPNPEDIELPAAGYSDEDLSDLDNLPDEPVKAAAPAAEKKSTRKVSEKAHANYRKLNIRGSKGAKAANVRTGRFARKKR